MVAQPLKDFLTPEFIERTAKTLLDVGFVSDEHEFAPYRETLNVHVSEIQKSLHEMGYDLTLSSGYINHPEAGYAYYIYDYNKFDNLNEASEAVSTWLDEKYSE